MTPRPPKGSLRRFYQDRLQDAKVYAEQAALLSTIDEVQQGLHHQHSQRVREGLGRARKFGVKLGRPCRDIPIDEVVQLYGVSIRNAARELGVSRSTAQRWLAAVNRGGTRPASRAQEPDPLPDRLRRTYMPKLTNRVLLLLELSLLLWAWWHVSWPLAALLSQGLVRRMVSAGLYLHRQRATRERQQAAKLAARASIAKHPTKPAPLPTVPAV